jgi:hemolysin activation/secretion protein
VLANNYRSPSVGSEQGQVFLRHINLTGHSDVLSAGYNKTDGMDSGSLSYSFPITRLQTRVNLFYSAGDTVVVEAPFDLIDLESETDTAGIRFDVTILNNISDSLTLDLGLETKESETRLLGLPYDFSPGSTGGLSKSTVASLGVQYQRRTTSTHCRPDSLIEKVWMLSTRPFCRAICLTGNSTCGNCRQVMSC